MKRMLLLVDPQCDFINGALPVPGAEDAMNALAAFLLANPDRYAIKVVTCDEHPHNHCSFCGEGGQWPRHCVRHSLGAAIWPPLFEALYGTAGEVLILAKGRDVDKEEYSIFNNPGAAAIIAAAVTRMEIDEIDICGLAGDICVLSTLKTGCGLLGREKFHVLGEFSPSLDGGAALDSFERSLCRCEG